MMTNLIFTPAETSKKMIVDHIRHSKSKPGYVSEKTIYSSEDTCAKEHQMYLPKVYFWLWQKI